MKAREQAGGGDGSASPASSVAGESELDVEGELPVAGSTPPGARPGGGKADGEGEEVGRTPGTDTKWRRSLGLMPGGESGFSFFLLESCPFGRFAR